MQLEPHGDPVYLEPVLLNDGSESLIFGDFFTHPRDRRSTTKLSLFLTRGETRAVLCPAVHLEPLLLS